MFVEGWLPGTASLSWKWPSQERFRLKVGTVGTAYSLKQKPKAYRLRSHTVDGRNPAPLGNHGKPLFVGVYRGSIIKGFLRLCRISSMHSMAN